jgi:hypothetical protein
MSIIIEVIKLELTEMSGWEEQHYKPMILKMTEDTLKDITELYGENRKRWSRVSTNRLAEVAGSMVTYTDLDDETDGVIDISNGWDTTRFTFRLVILVEQDGFVHHYSIHGFTDKTDLSHTKSIDPEMLLYMTSITHEYANIGRPDRVRREQPSCIITGEHMLNGGNIQCNDTSNVLSQLMVNGHDETMDGYHDAYGGTNVSMAPINKNSMDTYNSSDVSPMNWLASIISNFMYNDRHITSTSDDDIDMGEFELDASEVNINEAMVHRHDARSFSEGEDALCVAISNLIAYGNGDESYRWSTIGYEDLSELSDIGLKELDQLTSISMVSASSAIDDLVGDTLFGSSSEINGLKLISDVVTDFMVRFNVLSLEFSANNYDIVDNYGFEANVLVDRVICDSTNKEGEIEARGTLLTRYIGRIKELTETHILPIISSGGDYPVAFTVRGIVNRVITIGIKFDSDDLMKVSVPLFSHSLQSGLLVKNTDYGVGRDIVDTLTSTTGSLITHLKGEGFSTDVSESIRGGTHDHGSRRNEIITRL